MTTINTGGGSDTINTGNGNDTINSGAGSDVIFSGAGNDFIDAGSGNDFVDAGSGNDTVDAGSGNDTVIAGSGNDNVDAGSGNDVVDGGDGDDFIDGASGDDTIFGGAGNDTLLGGSGVDTVYGGSGNDTIGSAGGRCGDGNESGGDLIYGDGRESYASAALAATLGSDVIYSGSGDDRIYGDNGTNLSGVGVGGNDRIFAGSGSDVVYGEGGNDEIHGEGGDDVLDGGSGNDVISGDEGKDVVFGGAGNDVISGGDGKDTLYGGSGDDTIGVNDGSSRHGDAFENGKDTIYGDGRETYSSTAVAAMPGNDTILSGRGNDLIYGDNGTNLEGSAAGGNDDIYAGSGNDVVYGEGGDDELFGENGNDTLSGGAGNDRLVGGLGADTLKGGAGNDVFAFSATVNGNGGDGDHHGGDHHGLSNWSDSYAGSLDLIVDFKGINDVGIGSPDLDKIDLTQLLGTTDLQWGGNSPTANGVWFTTSGGNTYVFADVTGNLAGAELAIKIAGVHNLVAGDFLGVATPINVVADTNGADVVVEAGYATTGDPTASGNVLANDSAPGTIVVTNPGTYAGVYGTLVLAADGGWTYNLNNADADTNAIAQGQVANDVFSYTASNGSGTASSTLTITIGGANDAPVLGAVTGATYNDTVADDTFSAVSGTLSKTDPDTGDTATYSISGGAADNSLAGYNTSASSAYGKLYLNSSTGAYLFQPNDAAIEALKTAAGASFTLVVTDGHGATDSETLSVTLNGANDAPVLSASLTSATYTDTAADDSFGAVSGTLSTTDRDAGDSATYSIGGGAADNSLLGYDTSASNAYGKLYLNSATGAYTFQPTDAAIEALKTGASTSFSFVVTDGSGATASQTLSLTLNGANDGPALSASLTSATYTDTAADDSFSAVSGTLSTTDRDAGDSATYSISGGSADNSLLGYDTAASNAYGKLYLNSSTGAYTFQPNDAGIEGLKNNTGASFTLVVTDGSGATASQTLSLTLIGANDAPVLSATLTSATYTDTAADDVFNAVGGTLSTTDRDAGDSATYSITGGATDNSVLGYDTSASGAYGKLYVNSTSGAYQFVPSDTAIEGLKTTASTSFTLVVTDGSGATANQTLSLTLNGANDGPALSATLTSATYTDTAADDTFSALGGTLSTTDRDAGDSATYSITGGVADNSLLGYDTSASSAYGKLYLNSTSGAYQFVPTDAAIEGLKTTASAGFTLVVTDGSGATASQALTVTLNGANDGPALSATLTSATYTDTAADDTFSALGGTLSATDRDLGDSAAYSISGGAADNGLLGYDTSASNAYGRLYLNSTSGAYTFQPNDAGLEALKTNTNASFTLLVTDGSGATASQTLSLTLNGANDPVSVGSVSVTGTTISFVASDRDDPALSLETPFDSAFGNPAIVAGATSSLTATEQVSARSGTLRVTDGATAAAVIGLYLGSAGNEAAAAPLAAAANAMYGFGGDDTLTGGTAADKIFGGTGNDTLAGGGGTDAIAGEGGDDRIAYETGATLHGDAASASAGTDGDTVVLATASNFNLSLANQDVSAASVVTGFENVDASAVAGAVTLTGSGGVNTLIGGASSDNLVGGAGADSLVGGGGNDTFSLANGDFAAGETLDGGSGTDTILLTTAGTTVDLSTGTLSQVERLLGSAGNDNVSLSAAQWGGMTNGIDLDGGAADTLTVFASGGADLTTSGTPTVSGVETGNLVGSAGDDSVTLTGTQLDRIVLGATGAIDLGAGSDTLNLTSFSSVLNSGLADARISGVEGISAAGAPSSVYVNLSNQTEGFTVTGSGSTDVIYTGSGVDTLNAGGGDDQVYAANFSNGETLDGGAGTNDYLFLNGASTVDFTNGTVTIGNFENLYGTVGDHNVTLSAAQWGALTGSNGIALVSGTDTVTVLASGTVSFAATTPTVSGVETGNLVGSASNDNVTLTGTQLDRIVLGAAGAIDLGAGSDILNLTSFSSVLNSALADARISGVESISAATAPSSVYVNLSNQTEGFTVTGSNSNDAIFTGSGVDTVNAGGGDDSVYAANFSVGETLDGGAGTNDYLYLNGTSTVDFTNGTVTLSNFENLYGALGDHNVTLSAAQWGALTSINLPSGTDTVTVVASGALSFAASTPTVSGVETGNLVGSAGDDSVTLTGTQLDRIVLGATGAIDLGAGSDTLNLTSFSSVLNSGLADARISGVEGISAAGAPSSVYVNLSNQTEGFTVTGSGSTDVIYTGSGVDTLNAGGGDDQVYAANFSNGETLDGGAGTNDYLFLNGASTVDFTNGTVTIGNFENLYGTVGDHNVTLSAAQWGALTGSNGIALVSGTDTVTVLASGTVSFAATTPTVSGVETGNLVGSASNDNVTLTGTQLDRIVLGAAGAIDLGAGSDTLNLTSFSSLLSGALADARISGVEAISATSASGAVNINLAGQSDGGFVVRGSAFNDSLTGGTGGDIMLGGAGVDTMSSGGGNDYLVGGLGNDSVTSGTGADQFRLRTDGGIDTITDYTDDTDKIGFLGGAVAGGVSFATAASLGGTTLSAADFHLRGSISAILSSDDNSVISIGAVGQTTSQITSTIAGSATNAYVLVFNQNAGVGQIWFDSDWSDTANRVQIATLTGVSTGAAVAAITESDIVVYDTTYAPAGIAGSPISLGLDSVAAGHVGNVSVTVGAMPAGWTLSGGTQNGDGSWTAQTGNPAAVTVTTPADFVGARVLPVTVLWTNSDGSHGATVLDSNLEAYAPGNPVFAIAGDDNLSGSSAADLIVFAQPIAHDTIHGFDAANDRIDLIGFGVSQLGDLAIADDASGSAVVTLAHGSTITLLGVHAAALGAQNFVFDVEPSTVNSGTMTIGDGAILPLGGVVDNSGTIALQSTGGETDFQVLADSVTLRGGGHVVLSDASTNKIFAAVPSATLHNIDNTISGAGQIGAGQMTLVNDGTIVADGTHALVVDTGAAAVVNTGALVAAGGGSLVVESALVGDGSATVIGSGSSIELAQAAHVDVGFTADASGALLLDHAGLFNGTLAGFDGNDQLTLGDVAFGAGTSLHYAANAAGTAGTLTVTDGTHTAQLALVGGYGAADFHLAAASGGGTAVTTSAGGAGVAQVGTAGHDVLVGTAGNDVLVGGDGSDTLTGGAGSDTFVFRGSDGGAVDTITDFDAGAGGDVVLLEGLLQGYSEVDAAQFIGLREVGGNTIVSIDHDGAGTAHGMDDAIVLTGVTGLELDTFVHHVDVTTHP